MGGQWGVNRSVSQIHALLYLSERPLTAEEIADTLGLARSNVSNSIKELLGWNLIRRVPIRATGAIISRPRPTSGRCSCGSPRAARSARSIRRSRRCSACVADAERDPGGQPGARATRLKDMLGFIEMMDRWYAQMLTVPKPQIATAIRLGAKV